MAGMRKQVSFFLPVAQWVLIRNEAIRLGIPITELIRRWMSDEMRRLEASSQKPNNSPPRQQGRRDFMRTRKERVPCGIERSAG